MVLLFLSFIFLVLFPLNSESQESEPQFCDSTQLSSVFNINNDIYFIESKDKSNIFWKYGSNKTITIDKQLESVVNQIGFDTNSPILGFQFTEVFECSIDIELCRDHSYASDGFDECNKYCKEMVKIQDMIIIIGFDSNGKQLYQALRHNSDVFEIINDNKHMPYQWPTKSQLSNKTFFPITKESRVLVAISYIRSRHELIMVLSADGDTDTFFVASLEKYKWYQYLRWLAYKSSLIGLTSNSDSTQPIGLFENDSNVYALKTSEKPLLLFKIFGPQNLSRSFDSTNTTLKALLNCKSDTIIRKDAKPSIQSEIPKTSFWQLFTIPIIVIILIVLSAIIAYYRFCRKDPENNKSINRRPKSPSNDSLKEIFKSRSKPLN